MSGNKSSIPSPFADPDFLRYLDESHRRHARLFRRAERDISKFYAQLSASRHAEDTRSLQILAYRALRSCDLLAEDGDPPAAADAIAEIFEAMEAEVNEEQRFVHLRAYAEVRFRLAFWSLETDRFGQIWDTLADWMQLRTTSECLSWFSRKKSFKLEHSYRAIPKYRPPSQSVNIQYMEKG